MKINVFPLKNGDSFYICDENKKIINNKPFDYLSPFANGFAVYGSRQNGKENYLYGLVTDSGSVFLNAEYSHIYRLGYQLERVLLINKKKAHLYDTKSKKIIYTTEHFEPDYREFNFIIFNNGPLFSSEGESGGYIENNYDGESYGLIDMNGKELLTSTYNLIDYPKEGIIRVNVHGTLLDVSELDFFQTEYLYNGTLKAPIGGFSFYIELATNKPLPNNYKFCWNFNEGIARVLIEGEFDIITSTEGKYIELKNPIFAYINTSGEILYTVEKSFRAYDYKDGRALIQNRDNQKFWLMEKDGHLIKAENKKIKIKEIDSFLIVTRDDKIEIRDLTTLSYIFNHANNCTIDYISNNIFHQKIKKNNDEHDLIILSYKKGGQLRIIDKKLNLESSYVRDELLFVSVNGKKGVNTIDGSVIIPIEYDRIEFDFGLFAVYNKSGRYTDIFLGYYTLLGAKLFF
jgi:hypothetical protein